MTSDLPLVRAGARLITNTPEVKTNTDVMSDQWSGEGACGPEGDPEELRLVLIGRTGSGKSASGNTILGRHHFLSALRACSVTRACERGVAEWEESGRRKEVLVVDLPGFDDTHLDARDLHSEIAKCVALTAPGPHAFLLVIPLGRYTEDEDRAVEQMVRVFGEEALLHTVVLFTRGDELEDGGLESFLGESAPDRLKVLLRRCGGRYHVFNNRRPENRAQVRVLLRTVEKMLRDAGNTCYTSNMFLQAEQAIREEQQRMSGWSSLQEQTSEGWSSLQERPQCWRLRRAVSRRQVLRSTLSRFRTQAALSGKVLERVKVLVAAGAAGMAVGAVFGAAAPLAVAAGASVMGGSLGLAAGQLAGVSAAGSAVIAAASGKTAVALGAAAGGVLGGSLGALAGADAAGPQEAALEALQQVGVMGAAVVGVAAGVGGAVGTGAVMGAVLQSGAGLTACETAAGALGTADVTTTAALRALDGVGTNARIVAAVAEMGRAAAGILLAGGLVLKVVKEKVRSGSGAAENSYTERNSYEIYWNK